MGTKPLAYNRKIEERIDCEIYRIESKGKKAILIQNLKLLRKSTIVIDNRLEDICDHISRTLICDSLLLLTIDLSFEFFDKIIRNHTLFYQHCNNECRSLKTIYCTQFVSAQNNNHMFFFTTNKTQSSLNITLSTYFCIFSQTGCC